MASISTNAFDLMRFPKARYVADANGKPVVVIPVDDESLYRIRKDNSGGVTIQCPIVCQSKFNQPTSPTAPTHEFMLNFTKEQREAKVQQMLQFLNEHPDSVEGLVTRYTDLKKQPNGDYCYVNKDGVAGSPKSMDYIASLITYARITFAPGWLIKAQTPQPTAQAQFQSPADGTDPFSADAYGDPDSDLPF